MLVHGVEQVQRRVEVDLVVAQGLLHRFSDSLCDCKARIRNEGQNSSQRGRWSHRSDIPPSFEASMAVDFADVGIDEMGTYLQASEVDHAIDVGVGSKHLIQAILVQKIQFVEDDARRVLSPRNQTWLVLSQSKRTNSRKVKRRTVQ